LEFSFQQKLCLELLKKQFDKLPDKDKYILGHSMGVFGYEKKTLDEVALVEMMTIDGVIKARKAIIKKLIKTGKYHD
jgi:malonyl CoA-acyl carrier protein transacylase